MVPERRLPQEPGDSGPVWWVRQLQTPIIPRLVASNGGGSRSPGWYFNLRKNPEATVTLRGRRIRMVAREATGAEREELWKRALSFYSGYRTYQERAGARRIPLLVLSPAELRGES